MEPLNSIALEEGSKISNSTTSNSIVRSKSSERRWMIYINEIIEKELINKTNFCPSIFIVPKFLSAAKPQHYIPQFLAFGPYHHFSQDLYDMERYKLIVAKQMHQFNSFVARLSQFELDIRACYHRRLDLDADTLALVMAIDGLFLLELLCSQVQTHDILRPLNHFSKGKRLLFSNNDAALRDIVKLENQIPFLVLRQILVVRCEVLAELIDDDLFANVLVGFCREISPFNLNNNYSVSQVVDSAHVLDLLYNLILPEKMESSHNNLQKEPMNTQNSSVNFNLSGFSLEGFPYPWRFKKVFEFIQRLLSLLPLVGGFVSSMKEYCGGTEDKNRIEVSIEDKTPLMEAGIMVPTASELFDAGVSFKPTASIKTIKFETKTATFMLPAIELGVNSEVILKNLVAYEAMAMPDCLVFTRYLQLMNTFIDTEKDVRIFKDAKIVVSGIMKDREIAVLFNGMMNNSIGFSFAKELDDAINGVNKYYEGRAKVKTSRIIKKYVYSSWRILALMATLIILGLLVLQSFCSVYNCPQLFGTMEIGEQQG